MHVVRVPAFFFEALFAAPTPVEVEGCVRHIIRPICYPVCVSGKLPVQRPCGSYKMRNRPQLPISVQHTRFAQEIIFSYFK